MTKLFPERHKIAGLSYAYYGELELPVLDLSHPSFQIALNDSEIEAWAAKALSAQQGRMPAFLQRMVLGFFFRRSLIGRGLMAAKNSFLDARTTYLLKLGPEALGEAYATAIDRKISGSAGLPIRLRTQDLAQLLAEGLRPLLRADAGRPLVFVNIAGGPAMDSLNALNLLRRGQEGILADRPVHNALLDQDSSGPEFAANSLAALQSPGGALEGLGAGLKHHPYDWRGPEALQSIWEGLPREPVLALSSEGGLFDYGSDEDVLANLKALHTMSPPDCLLVGSLSRPEWEGARGLAALRTRSLGNLQTLIAGSGWRLRRSRVRPSIIAFELIKS